MKSSFFAFVAVCALTTLAHADKAPLILEAPQSAVPGQAPLQTFTLNMTPFPTFFAMLGVSAKCKFIVADDVHGLMTGTINGRSTEEIVQRFCSLTHLAWGKAGADTYLIVRQTPVLKMEAVVPPLSQRLPRTPNDFIIGRVPGLTDKVQSEHPDGWQPFDFNGQKLYVVPTAPQMPKN